MTSTAIAVTKTAGYIVGVELLITLGIPGGGLVALLFLMSADIATGLAKQYIVNPQKITSHNFWIGIVKKLITLLLVVSLGVMFFGTGMDGKTYISGIIGLFIVGEMYSIIGNAYTVRTGKFLPEYDVISIAIKGIGDTIKNSLEKSLTKK